MKFYKFFVTLVFAAFFVTLAVTSPSCARVIRVGLATGVASASISGRGITVQDASRRRASSASGFTAQARGNSVVINGKSFSSPVTVTSSASLSFAKFTYEGEIVLIASGGRLTVVNRLDIEKYLRGVVSFEISPKWAQEVLKAQAIISRTFAIAQMGRHNSAGFDVCNADHCQVYKGTSVYNASTDRAISQTRDRVLTYKGQLAQTYFCSDSGGATANIADVWGKPIPYLIVRKEPYPSESPNATWEVTLTSAEIQNALAKKGKGVGTLRGISISQRDAAGRATALTFEGSAGRSTMTSSNFRTLIGAKKLRSTFFDFSSARGKNPAPRKGTRAPAKGASTANLSRGSVTLYGRGWGHGVGMSQWGAKAMADHGWSAEKILEFYYPGTSIQKR